MADESDDDFVSYGTSLEPLEDDAVRRKPVLLEEQVVTDQQGRRRFHGAFTGGFSAGYFNSVGSKEGWAPSTFVSSRSQKTGGQSGQRAEDFMDEEDLGDFGIAPRKIVTTDKFTGEERARKRPQQTARPSVIPGDSPLQDLIVPNNDSMGARLLRKMGWRHGQGVGPKVRRRKKKSALNEIGTGASKSDGEGDGGDLYGDFLFAPADVEEIALKPKDDHHGLGYRGLDPALAGMGQHVVLFEEQPLHSRSGKRGMTGQAFGVGAFEGADEDIYGVDNMAKYDRVLGGEDPDGGNYGWTAPKARSGKGGAGMLEDFKVSTQRRPPNKVFPPPLLPRDFRPFHVTGKSSTKENQPPSDRVAFKSSRFVLSAAQRGAMLGEEQLPGPSSVFDFLSPDDHQKLKASSTPHQSAASSRPEEQLDSKPTKGRFHQAPPVDAAAPTASDPQRIQALGGGYQPFANDATKQQRYDEYLARKRGGQDSSVVAPSGSLTEWERQRETEEFARAASLYKPLPGLMATRFVSAKNRDDEETVDVPAEEGGDKSSQAKAADMKMFGKLTRDSLEWHPDALLCKRFNIPNPYPESSVVGLPTVKKDKFSVFNFLTINPSAGDLPPASTSPAPPNPGHGSQGTLGGGAAQQSKDKLSRWDKKPALLANVGVSDMHEGLQDGDTSGPGKGAHPEVKASSSEALDSHQPTDDGPEDEGRPPMDLFKAIFDSSSSSEDDGGGDDDDDEEEEVQEAAENAKGRNQTQDDSRLLAPPAPAGPATADHSRPFGTSPGAACPADRISGVPTPPLGSGSESDGMYYGPSLPPPTPSTAAPRSPGGVGGRRGRDAEGRSRPRDAGGGRRQPRDHKKEKRKKKQDGRSSSHHKRRKEKKHKSKTKRKAKKRKERKVGNGRGRGSPARAESRGQPHTAAEIDYDASGSSSSSSSSSEDSS